MSLLEDVEEWFDSAEYPPSGRELDWVPEGATTSTKMVRREILDDSLRWGNLIRVVYQRGDEYVAVEIVEPATEMQDWGDYGDPEIYEVRPVEVTVTKYEKV